MTASNCRPANNLPPKNQTANCRWLLGQSLGQLAFVEQAFFRTNAQLALS